MIINLDVQVIISYKQKLSTVSITNNVVFNFYNNYIARINFNAFQDSVGYSSRDTYFTIIFFSDIFLGVYHTVICSKGS